MLEISCTGSYGIESLTLHFDIFQLSVSVVLARGLVCDELKLLSEQDQLVIIEMVPYRTLEILADSCQADMVTYLTLASEVSLSQQDQLVIIEDSHCRSKAVLLLWIFYVFVLSCVCFVLCASVYMCFVVTCWERADLLALVCGVFCEFVTFQLVSWVRCGT